MNTETRPKQVGPRWSTGSDQPRSPRTDRPPPHRSTPTGGRTTRHQRRADEPGPHPSCGGCATNSNSRPNNEWNRCVTRTHRYRSSESGAVDDGVQLLQRATRTNRQSRAHRPNADLRTAPPTSAAHRIRAALQHAAPHRGQQLRPPRPEPASNEDGPKDIVRRPEASSANTDEPPKPDRRRPSIGTPQVQRQTIRRRWMHAAGATRPGERSQPDQPVHVRWILARQAG
jgi:hypothetical protein